MKDYSCIPMIEAFSEEIIHRFVVSIKQMDTQIATKRLATLFLEDSLKGYQFLMIASQFNALTDCITCVDKK